MTPPQDSERISKDKISGAIEALRGLDAKELPDVPAKVAIRKMRRQIERVLKLGYTYDEVSEVLAGLDINISGNRIKYLLGEVRKETRSRKRRQIVRLVVLTWGILLNLTHQVGMGKRRMGKSHSLKSDLPLGRSEAIANSIKTTTTGTIFNCGY